MAVIKDSIESEEIKKENAQGGPHPAAGSFEEVQQTKARLFHSQKEVFDLWGIKNHLVSLAGAAAVLCAAAAFPFILTVEDSQSLVVPARMVNMEAVKEGIITDVFVQEGEHVKKGQVLARITNSGDEKHIARLKGSLKLAEARLSVLDAKRIYRLERYEEDKRLMEQKVISRDEFRKTEISFRVLEEERQVVRVELQVLGDELLWLEKEKNTGVVIAPMAGKVISPVGEKYGTYAVKEEFLLTLASEEQRLEFFLAEEDYGRVKVGDPAKIRFYPMPGETCVGRVAAFKHYAEPLDKYGFKKNFIKVLIDVENFPSDIRNGMTAKVRIQGRPVSLFNSIRRRIG